MIFIGLTPVGPSWCVNFAAKNSFDQVDGSRHLALRYQLPRLFPEDYIPMPGVDLRICVRNNYLAQVTVSEISGTNEILSGNTSVTITHEVNHLGGPSGAWHLGPKYFQITPT